MIYVLVTVKIRPGTLEDFVRVAYPCIEATRREAGCLLYELSASVTDPDLLFFTEQWESRAHLDAHLKTGHIAEFSAANTAYVVEAIGEVIHPDRVEPL